MTRYQLVLKGDTGLIHLDRHPSGSWVRWEDVEALIEQHAIEVRALAMTAADNINEKNRLQIALLNSSAQRR